MGVRAESYRADVSNKNEVVKMIDQVIQDFGKIDILVNNAAILEVTDFFDVTEEEWDKILAVNLKGAFLVTQAVAKHMVERRYGKIIMLSCASVKSGGKTASLAYYASKAGMIVLGKIPGKISGKLWHQCEHGCSIFRRN